MAGKGGFREGYIGSLPLQDPAPGPAHEVGSDGRRVDSTDGGPVAGRICRAIGPQESRDRGPEGGLQEWDPGSGSRSPGDWAVGRVRRPQRASQKLGAQHAEVVGEGEH